MVRQTVLDSLREGNEIYRRWKGFTCQGRFKFTLKNVTPDPTEQEVRELLLQNKLELVKPSINEFFSYRLRRGLHGI